MLRRRRRCRPSPCDLARLAFDGVAEQQRRDAGLTRDGRRACSASRRGDQADLRHASRGSPGLTLSPRRTPALAHRGAGRCRSGGRSPARRCRCRIGHRRAEAMLIGSSPARRRSPRQHARRWQAAQPAALDRRQVPAHQFISLIASRIPSYRSCSSVSRQAAAAAARAAAGNQAQHQSSASGAHHVEHPRAAASPAASARCAASTIAIRRHGTA